MKRCNACGKEIGCGTGFGLIYTEEDSTDIYFCKRCLQSTAMSVLSMVKGNIGERAFENIVDVVKNSQCLTGGMVYSKDVEVSEVDTLKANIKQIREDWKSDVLKLIAEFSMKEVRFKDKIKDMQKSWGEDLKKTTAVYFIENKKLKADILSLKEKNTALFVENHLPQCELDRVNIVIEEQRTIIKEQQRNEARADVRIDNLKDENERLKKEYNKLKADVLCIILSEENNQDK